MSANNSVIIQDSDINQSIRFNAVLDCILSDQGSSLGNGVQVLNLTESGFSITNSLLINGIIFILFIDGVQYTAVQSFSAPPAKEFIYDPLTGIITLSISMPSNTPVTVFYTSPGTTGLPGVEPVTIAEVKAYCKIDTGTIDDDILTELIITARQQAEDFTNISIVARSVTVVVKNLNGGIYLPYCPFLSLTSIKDQYGNDIDPANYILSGTMFPQLIKPCWDRMTLVYEAGYGIPPSKIKTAILQQVFYLYENRGESAVISRSGVVAELTLSPQAKATLNRFRRVF